MCNITEAYNFISPEDLISCSGTLINVNLKSLSDSNYDAVINLLPNNGKKVKAGEKEEFTRLGILYFYIPIEWDSPKQSDFEEFEKILSSLKGKKVHIHCTANYRASAFYALYCYRNNGWSEAKLRKFIHKIWDLEDYPIWENFIKNIIGHS